jgi:hypothetical protein
MEEVCQQRVGEVATEVRVRRWMMMIWIDGGIGRRLLGVVVHLAAGAALRGCRTSW